MMILGLGLLLGMQHATEADHLAAVATLAGRERSLGRGLRLGVAWGCGHALTLLVVAGGVGLLGGVISPQWAGRFEQAVGAMLIGLGLHLGWRQWHERVHMQADGHRQAQRLPLRSLLVGMVHGLAGSAALALVASQVQPGAAAQLAYIALFGLGSIIGMALLSAAVAFSVTLSARRLTRWHGVFNGVIAALTVVLGLRLLLA
jgi:cytochrome c biogenesis protein CcdA